jgi:hypothetical protein
MLTVTRRGKPILPHSQDGGPTGVRNRRRKLGARGKANPAKSAGSPIGRSNCPTLGWRFRSFAARSTHSRRGKQGGHTLPWFAIRWWDRPLWSAYRVPASVAISMPTATIIGRASGQTGLLQTQPPTHVRVPSVPPCWISQQRVGRVHARGAAKAAQTVVIEAGRPCTASPVR